MWRWEQVAAYLTEPRLGAELGVKEGRFTEYMLTKFTALRMVAVDLWAPRPPCNVRGYETYADWDFGKILREFHQRTDRFADRLTVLREDTRAAATRFSDASIDFVFIDAEHTYEGVKGDIAAWLPKVKSGGLLCGHDYSGSFPGVCDAVNELRKSVLTGTDKVWAIRVD